MGTSTHEIGGGHCKSTYAYEGRGGGGQIFAILVRTYEVNNSIP